jgi:hypothetical protein
LTLHIGRIVGYWSSFQNDPMSGRLISILRGSGIGLSPGACGNGEKRGESHDDHAREAWMDISSFKHAVEISRDQIGTSKFLA